jgi:hypothetical protein
MARRIDRRPSRGEIDYVFSNASAVLGGTRVTITGPIYAKELVHAFSDAVFDVIEQDPSRLRLSRVDQA